MPPLIPVLLAIWGALVSTCLASIRIWEFLEDRPRLTTSYGFGSDPDDGNEIILENPSTTPVMISYWELLLDRREGWVRRRRVVNGRFPNEGYCNITVGAHSRHALTFKGKDHFEWGAQLPSGTKIHLVVHVVGRRRPVRLLVYPRA